LLCFLTVLGGAWVANTDNGAAVIAVALGSIGIISGGAILLHHSK
jgi:hypothetical protein